MVRVSGLAHAGFVPRDEGSCRYALMVTSFSILLIRNGLILCYFRLVLTAPKQCSTCNKTNQRSKVEFTMATDDMYEGWVGEDKSSAEGKMVWKQFVPKVWEETDVEIKITHSGVCGSDVHTLRSGWVSTRTN